MVVIVFTVATIAVSCSDKVPKTEQLDLADSPSQRVENMVATQTDFGKLTMRMETPLLERFTKSDDESYEDFPKGIRVYGYNEEGLLETQIESDGARHTTSGRNEKWSAYGNVVIRNYIKGERIETDTLYWDRSRKMIFTDCYVRLISPQGFMQGYGLESDEMARNAQLLSPFDSYGIVTQDTTYVSYVDSANFIGPLYKR